MIATVIGPRNLQDQEKIENLLKKAIEDLGCVSYIYHGDSKFDTVLSKICKKLKIKTLKFKAEWGNIVGKPDKYIKESQYGKYYSMAGFDRDKEMLSKSSCLICMDLESGLIHDAKKMDKIIYMCKEVLKEGESFSFWD